MLINLVDALNSMLQAILFIYLIDYCIDDYQKKSTIQKITAIIVVFLIICIINYKFGNLSV